MRQFKDVKIHRSINMLGFLYRNFLRYLRFGASGITLMELIVVIIISSLIAGTFATIFYRVTNSDLSNATEKEMERIETAFLEFYKDMDQFPLDSGFIGMDFLDLESLPATTRFEGSASLQSYRQSRWDGPYIQDKFNDNGYMTDAWQNAYVYDYNDGDDYCVVTSYGPDRTTGGGDDIVIQANARSIREDKIKATQDELNIIQLALNDYVTATDSAPSSIDDLFDWEVLNLHMDEASWVGTADEVVDMSGEGNHGTAAGGATTTSSGKVGRAGSFDASAQKYLNTSATSVATTLTLEAWIYPTAYPGERATIIQGMTSNGYYLSLASDGSLQCYWYSTTPVGYHSSGASTVSLNAWSHVVATWDGSNVRLYVNGVQKNTVAVTGAGVASTINRIGAENVARQFVGTIDEVRIYSVALSAEEIFRHYENPGYPRDYFDLHDYAFKYDEWETSYALGSTSVGGNTVHYFYSCGPDRATGVDEETGVDYGADDIEPLGLP